jgi:hypothetical protein
MLVPIVCEKGEIVQWALVELQGRVEQQLDIEPGAPLPIGTLQLSPAVSAAAQRRTTPACPCLPSCGFN